ncbi:unnamed protein product, partial [Heterotrigona itama]
CCAYKLPKLLPLKSWKYASESSARQLGKSCRRD